MYLLSVYGRARRDVREVGSFLERLEQLALGHLGLPRLDMIRCGEAIVHRRVHGGVHRASTCDSGPCVGVASHDGRSSSIRRAERGSDGPVRGEMQLRNEREFSVFESSAAQGLVVFSEADP
jgi:hypothetical protein